jgi:serine/threonine-protein kinase
MLNRMLALHPADRYQSANAVHHDLQRLLGVLMPMIWRPEHVSWQGFASPIQPTATDQGRVLAKDDRQIETTDLPPTQLQRLGQKIGQTWGRTLSSMGLPDTTVATLPPTTSPIDQASQRRILVRGVGLPQVWQCLDWRSRLTDCSPRWVITAGCLIITGIGMHVFRTPTTGSEQILPSSGMTPSTVKSSQPTIVATGPSTIEFAPGEVSAFVQGNLQENQTRIYQFRATKGQIMGVTLEGSGVKMNLLRADQSPVDHSSRQTRNWSGQLPASELYQIQITGSGAYSLDMAIAPNQMPKMLDDQRINFEQGATKTVTGEVLAGQQRRYVISAQKGQQIGFKVLQGDLSLKVIAPTGKPLGRSTTAWQGKVPIQGAYTIEISAKKREDYALSLELH